MAAMDVDMGEENVAVEEEEVGREDAWTVISSFLRGKGLARQQLDSFNEFIQHTMREIVGAWDPALAPNSRVFLGQLRDRDRLTHLAPPHCSNRRDVRFHDRAGGAAMPGEEADGKGKKKYKVEFKQIYL